MTRLDYESVKRINLKTNPHYDERWVQDRIAEDPSILELGDLIVKDKERSQARGRLDFLLQDADATERYEVEIQLGASDPDHIIRTLEYWDYEKRRYQEINHTAVLVAEDITSRFLSVISLFNGHIPFIAIQMTAFEVADKATLVFTKVLDRYTLGFLEDEEEQEQVDRNYWEVKRGTQETVRGADELLELITEFEEGNELSYNRPYIGLHLNGSPNNFATFQPQKRVLVLRLKLPQSDEIDARINEAGLDMMDYQAKWKQYRVRLSPSDIATHRELLSALLCEAHAFYNS